MNIRSKSLKKHFIIGCFKKNYLFSVVEQVAELAYSVFNKDVFLGMSEDMLSNGVIEAEFFRDGYDTFTTISIIDFIDEDFFDDNGQAGFLHIVTTPTGFKIQFDPVDIPKEAGFLSKIPDEIVAKDYDALQTQLKKYKSIIDSIKPDIEKAKVKYGSST